MFVHMNPTRKITLSNKLERDLSISNDVKRKFTINILINEGKMKEKVQKWLETLVSTEDAYEERNDIN